ncbi:MAG: electron transport complex subunit RsxC [Kiritimatiellae bacterium]|jgi:electron transport complex protein RnfC|nr:electron transport complex subunit RsxC [Kiritimatiellia bacterium]
MNILKAKFKIHGGVHPKYRKELARDEETKRLPLPDILRISTTQHLGAPSKPVVKKGDYVKKYQLLAEAAGFISAPVHSPASGTIKDIVTGTGASGAPVTEIILETNNTSDAELTGVYPTDEWQKLSPETILNRIREAGVVGAGGAGFPTYVKLSPPPDKKIETLIINGAECEPYLTADYRLMLEHPECLIAGIQIICKVLNVTEAYIAIEDNKPEAIELLSKYLEDKKIENIKVSTLPTYYPQGAEKQQIYSITGREVPSGGLPADVGVLVENTGTTVAIYNAVIKDLPFIERTTTVSGYGIETPSNVIAPIGTPYQELIDFCGGAKDDVKKIISGGPMMGFAQATAETTTTKTTSGLLLLTAKEISQFESSPCISCGRCIAACPMNLMPAELSQFCEAEDFESAAANRVMDCMECGCCAFSCPAHRPLVQHFRTAKAFLRAQPKK